MILSPAPDTSSGYWAETDARIKSENRLDRHAARCVNADNILIDCLAFGSVRSSAWNVTS